MIPEKLSHFQVKQKLGSGGMGEVYLARDTILDRTVALKILPSDFGNDDAAMRRFLREAKAASALSHSNVAHIYEIGEAENIHFIAMEYVEGETLAAKIAREGRLNSTEIISIALQLADALDEAHTKGITHRDLKPGNIMITPRGQIKLLDFGLAQVRRIEDLEAASEVATITKTQLGVVLGTLPYMSPEQTLGKGVDQRSDYFSLGAVLYQMATGNLPFTGTTAVEIIDAILHKEPAPLTTDAPRLKAIISKLLAKDPAARYQTAKEIIADLQNLSSTVITDRTIVPSRKFLIKKSVVIPALVVILGGLVFAFWHWNRRQKNQMWAKETALPEINRLIDAENFLAAYDLANRAEQYIGGNPALEKLWPEMSETISVETVPSGADVYRKPYEASDQDWQLLARTPIQNRKVPLGSFHWKVIKPGFQTVLFVTPNTFPAQKIGVLKLQLEEESKAPQGMVKVPADRVVPEMSNTDTLPPVDLESFWIDQYEVTNRQFKEFVAHKGYQNPDLWPKSFLKDRKNLSWQDALSEFRDITGRPGPHNWEVGDYPKGHENDPVTGVSWYEADAYCKFVGKRLPSLYHWAKASGLPITPQIVPLSNFSGKGLAAVGKYQGMNPYGTFDMAGNAKEWCWNEFGKEKRIILGGAWDEPEYMFNESDWRFPFDRSANNGFRCMKTASTSAEPWKPLDLATRDFRKEKPVSDDVFQYIKSFYSYDQTDLRPKLESVNKQSEYWIREEVTIDAAYGNERIPVYLFLPKNVSPPYQSVIYFPSGGSTREPSSRNLEETRIFDRVDFIIKSGRALIVPIYKGTFERRIPNTSSSDDWTPSGRRDVRIQQCKDLARSIDYLHTRKEFDLQKLGYFGISLGSSTIFPVVENRIKVAVLVSSGLSALKVAPEIDQINFLPHLKIPVLMLNGRHDYDFPKETNQDPMFRLLGTPEKDKRHAVYEGGHAVPKNIMIKEALAWFDRYLGPVS